MKLNEQHHLAQFHIYQTYSFPKSYSIKVSLCQICSKVEREKKCNRTKISQVKFFCFYFSVQTTQIHQVPKQQRVQCIRAYGTNSPINRAYGTNSPIDRAYATTSPITEPMEPAHLPIGPMEPTHISARPMEPADLSTGPMEPADLSLGLLNQLTYQ